MVIEKKSILRLLLLVAVLFTGCAKIVMPTGGPKDVTPPAIAKESPKNGSNNFKGNTIKISFNEFVTLNNTFEFTCPYHSIVCTIIFFRYGTDILIINFFF